MRTRLIAAFCSTLAIAPLAQAQEGEQQPAQGAQDQDQAEQQAPAQAQPEGQGADVAQPAQTGQVKVPNTAGAKEEAPGEVHTVVKGDTLWDLSNTYLGSPWYWPKVWSYNPQIANPHWIYPGNQVRFFPAGEQNPARVEVQTPEGEVAGNVEQGEMIDEGGEQRGVEVSGRIGYTPPKQIQVAHQAFVTVHEIEDAGKISHANVEALMLSYPMTVYVSFKQLANVKIGDTYVVFRTNRKIQNPITGADVGYLTDIVGRIRIVGTSDKYAIGQIAGSSDEIRRGDLVGPYGEPLTASITSKPNSRSLDGVVLSDMVPYLTISGEQSRLLVDKGSAEGVEVGNSFTIVRQADPVNTLTDPSKNQDPSLPVESIATCVAVDVKEHATTCLVTRAIVEIVPGDRAWMRPEGTRIGLR